MNKLKLEELSVESFETLDAPAGRGTVEAHYGTNPNTWKLGQSCNGATDCGTCYPHATCDGQDGCLGTSFDMQIC